MSTESVPIDQTSTGETTKKWVSQKCTVVSTTKRKGHGTEKKNTRRGQDSALAATWDLCEGLEAAAVLDMRTLLYELFQAKGTTGSIDALISTSLTGPQEQGPPTFRALGDLVLLNTQTGVCQVTWHVSWFHGTWDPGLSSSKTK